MFGPADHFDHPSDWTQQAQQSIAVFPGRTSNARPGQGVMSFTQFSLVLRDGLRDGFGECQIARQGVHGGAKGLSLGGKNCGGQYKCSHERFHCLSPVSGCAVQFEMNSSVHFFNDENELIGLLLRIGDMQN
jgi:hypothetical protein